MVDNMVETAKADLVGLVRLDDEGVARGAALFQAALNHHKPVSGRLRPNVDSRIVSFEQVLDEGRLSCMHAQLHHEPHSACVESSTFLP